MNVQPKVWDIRGTDFLDNPEQQLTAMRNEGAVVRAKIPLMGPVWMTTTDSAARKLLKDSVNFSRDPVAAGEYRSGKRQAGTECSRCRKFYFVKEFHWNNPFCC